MEVKWQLKKPDVTFILIPFFQLNGVDGADMDTIQNGQEDFSQPQKVTEVVESKINQVPC